VEYSITLVLYEWMHERRIVSAVAQVMGISGSTLSAKLRPTAAQARLSADELVSLFAAIREVGYRTELEGILHGFNEACRGIESVKTGPVAMVPQVLALAKGVGVLSDSAGRISRMNHEADLQRLCIMVRTEILPIVLQVECLLMRRLEKVRKNKRPAHAPLMSVEPQQNA
jgi:hypothetical protein